MKALRIVLPSLGLGIATLLVVPGSDSAANFVINGSSLSISQRDVRLHNTFSDAQSNNNTVAHPMFPGYDGAEMAVWKGVVEWGSALHGDGSGDTVGNNALGSGGANFDAAWMGNANGAGNSDQNVVSVLQGGCQSGVLAFALLPSSNGWQIQFCDQNANFADGPGVISNFTFDIQGVMAHEYGHVLGLGHSCSGGATMWASIGNGQESARSINQDDINGLQQIYGVAAATKPGICETSVSGSTLTIRGANFDFGNNEVWFTNANVTGAPTDPRVIVSGLSSYNGGTFIDVTIPANAGPGDVLVKIPGGGNDSLSNAFPTNLTGTISALDECPLTFTGTTPASIEALYPGTAQTVTLNGSGFENVTSVLLNLFENIPASEWTVVNDTTITLNMPQSNFLGANVLSVSNGTVQRDVPIFIVEPAGPRLELGTGDDCNVNPNGSNMNVTIGGTPGDIHRIYYSTSNVPSSVAGVTFDMGAGFTNFFFATQLNVQNKGWRATSAPIVFSGASMDFYSQSISLGSLETSNLQKITLTP